MSRPSLVVNGAKLANVCRLITESCIVKSCVPKVVVLPLTYKFPSTVKFLCMNTLPPMPAPPVTTKAPFSLSVASRELVIVTLPEAVSVVNAPVAAVLAPTAKLSAYPLVMTALPVDKLVAYRVEMTTSFGRPMVNALALTLVSISLVVPEIVRIVLALTDPVPVSAARSKPVAATLVVMLVTRPLLSTTMVGIAELLP